MRVFQRRLIVGLVIAAALLSRWFHLDAQSVWYDEAVVVLFSGKGLAWIFAHLTQDTMPPLNYLLLHFWLGLGRQEGAMRVLSFLFSAGSLPFAYLLARRLFGRRVALLAILLAIFSPFQIYFAQEARMYAQLSFFSLAAVYFFLLAWQEGGRWPWLGFALSSIAAAYTHNLGLLTLFSLDVFALGTVVVRGQGSGDRGQGSGVRG
ncbi:MAG: glycosyltransferase family 39 protein, partial [Chloroflexi bacterium]|nr:glycosyltransferase family 39 protein [Chloroflexota bacterium]